MATAIKRGRYWYAQWGTGKRGKVERHNMHLLVAKVSKTQAKRAAQKMYDESVQGRGPGNLPDLTWQGAARQYFEIMDSATTSADSRVSRHRKLKPWLSKYGDALVPANPDTARDLIGKYLQGFVGKRSAATINGYRVALTGLCNWMMSVPLVQWHYNPAYSNRHYLPKPDERLPEIIDDTDLDKMAKAMAGTACDTVYHVIRWTGMRLTEALELEWREVDLDRGLIRADKTKIHRDRDVHIMPELASYLGGLPRRSKYVCCSPRGKRWSRRNCQRYWSNICKAAGLPSSRHALRRTCATLSLLAGESAAVVAQQLGHSVQTMMKWYARLDQLRHVPNLGGSAAATAGSARGSAQGAEGSDAQVA